MLDQSLLDLELAIKQHYNDTKQARSLSPYLPVYLLLHPSLVATMDSEDPEADKEIESVPIPSPPLPK